MGLTLSPSMLKQLLLSKLHPPTLDLGGDTHGEKSHCPQALTGEEAVTVIPLRGKEKVLKSCTKSILPALIRILS